MKKILIFIVAFLFLSGCTRPGYTEKHTKKSRFVLGTIVEITVANEDKPKKAIAAAIKLAFAEIERVENLLSRFKPESDISRINTDAYKRLTKVSTETISLLEKSILLSQLTNGTFDITVRPLLEIWESAEKDKNYIPKTGQLKQALDKVGYQNIDIIKQEQAVFLSHPGMSLDLGGIAKGYAVDRAIAVLRQEGIQAALVNAGGDIYTLGRRQKSKKWRVALQHPRRKDTFLTTLEIEDIAVATSGDYQQKREIAGRRYSHIINPKTGFPVQDVPCSVTVLAGDCVSADALATAISVLGPKKGIDLVNRLENTEAIVVSCQKDELDILLSQGLEGKVKFNP